MARVLLGVTGGIAAYKACELTRRLVLAGHEVIPIVTAGAERFVTRETFTALANRPVDESPYPHLTLADLLVVAPPMNDRMWAHPATQANVALLRERGVELVGPVEGELAEGGQGMGRMAEPEEIFSRCQELVGGGADRPFAGRRVLVTAGGTREPLDAVRFVGNRSSGRKGVALAEEARRRGADVTLIASNLAVAVPRGVEVVETPTAEAMLEAALARDDADVVLMAAAV